MLLKKIKPNIATFHVFFTMFLVGIIPFDKILVTYAVSLWLISAIILMILQKNSVSSFRLSFGLLFSILLYLIFVIGVFYSKNKTSAFFDIQVKSSLFIIPLIIYFLRDFYKKYFNNILSAFVIANIIAALVCIFFAFYHSLSFNDGAFVFNSRLPGVFEDINTKPPGYFFYTSFSFFKHPAYFSMYLVLCVFIILYFFRNSYFITKKPLTTKIIYVSTIFFLILTLYFLESKAAYFTLFFIFFIYSVSYAISQRKLFLGASIILALLIAAGIGYKQSSRFYYINSALANYNDFALLVKNKDYKTMIDKYGIDRIPIWMVSAEIIKENIWKGVGSGDVSDNMKKKYREYELQNLEMNNLNTHNQYLATFVATGLLSFLIFMIWLFYPLFRKKSYHKNNFLILIFIGIISINFLFESVLNTISGVIFVAFFYSFLLFVNEESSDVIVN